MGKSMCQVTAAREFFVKIFLSSSLRKTILWGNLCINSVRWIMGALPLDPAGDFAPIPPYPHKLTYYQKLGFLRQGARQASYVSFLKLHWYMSLWKPQLLLT